MIKDAVEDRMRQTISNPSISAPQKPSGFFSRRLTGFALTLSWVLAVSGLASGETPQSTPEFPRVGFYVLAPHRLAIVFSLSNRYLGKAEDGYSTVVPATISYRLPLPDFAVDAGVERASLLIDTDSPVEINARTATPVKCEHLVPSRFVAQYCKVCHAFTHETHQRELTIQLVSGSASSSGKATVIVETRSALKRTPGWNSADPSATTPMPKINPLMDYTLRDTSINPGKDGEFFMTGSTGAPDMWAVTSEIRLWRSRDLITWTPVITEPRPRSVVWSIDREGTWERPVKLRDGAPFRPLWAPEIHYIRGTYWIPYSVAGIGTGLLKSVTGRPEGPYKSSLKVDAPLTTGIDASIFQDDDGKVYFLWAGGKIARMTKNMDALDEEPHQLVPTNAPMVGFEGASLFKVNGRYYLSAADWTNGDYNCFTASSKNIYGPYSDRYISVPHGGHTNFFKDSNGNLWSTFFGSDAHSPFTERPAVIPMHFDAHGELKPSMDKETKD